MRQRPRHAKTMQKTNKPDLLHVLHANPTLSNILLLPPQLKSVFISSSHFYYFYSVPTCLAPGPARGRLDDLLTVHYAYAIARARRLYLLALPSFSFVLCVMLTWYLTVLGFLMVRY